MISLTLRFDGIIDAIEVVVFCNEISVPVNHDGLIWDTHCSGSSANQKPSPMAWCRDLCDPAEQRIFPTYCALLHDHPFEKAGRLGTATNTALTNQLSLVAVGLRTLQMATVPVIYPAVLSVE